MGFYSNTLTLAFNSDCSRAVLSASGKINDCPSSNKKVFDTHTPHRTKRMKKKKEKKINVWSQLVESSLSKHKPDFLLKSRWKMVLSIPTAITININSNMHCWIQTQLSPHLTYCHGHSFLPLFSSKGWCCFHPFPVFQLQKSATMSREE